MILPSDKYDLLLLADWLEEFGTSYDIVKATAIRNNKYDLNFTDRCGNKAGMNFVFSGSSYYGIGYGNGMGMSYIKCLNNNGE